MDDVLGIVQHGVRLSHLYRTFRRYMCGDHVEHHAAYTSATAPSDLSEGRKASTSALFVAACRVGRNHPVVTISQLQGPPEGRTCRSASVVAIMRSWMGSLRERVVVKVLFFNHFRRLRLRCSSGERFPPRLFNSFFLMLIPALPILYSVES
jgi:hypothetical protein